MQPIDTEQLRERALEQERADERATVLLKRFGAGAIVALLFWIAFVVWSFHG